MDLHHVTTGAAAACAPSTVTEAEGLTVRVPLHGKYGRGRFMTLDALDWEHVRVAWGENWTLLSNGHGRSYVTSSRHALRSLADQPGSGDTSRLSRLLMGAGRGEVVIFRDGDPLNLRRANLMLLDSREAALRRHQREAEQKARLH